MDFLAALGISRKCIFSCIIEQDLVLVNFCFPESLGSTKKKNSTNGNQNQSSNPKQISRKKARSPLFHLSSLTAFLSLLYTTHPPPPPETPPLQFVRCFFPCLCAPKVVYISESARTEKKEQSISSFLERLQMAFLLMPGRVAAP